MGVRLRVTRLFSDRVPAWPGVSEAAAADPGGPVHLPDVGFATGVLPQDVGMTIAVEIAGGDCVPARAGLPRLPLPIILVPFISQM